MGNIFEGIQQGASDLFASAKETIGDLASGENVREYLKENPAPEPPGEDASIEERDAYDEEYDKWLAGKEAAQVQDEALPKPQRAAEKLDFGKPAPGISGGTGPGPISMPTRQPSYGAIKSPYEIVERGLGTQDLTKLLLDSLKAQARARVTSMSAPRIRGLLG